MTDNHDWPEGAPRHAPYHAFTADHDEEAAAEQYRQRHGEDPEWVFEYRDGLLRLGPVPERGRRVA
jgi:hypothetical protein